MPSTPTTMEDQDLHLDEGEKSSQTAGQATSLEQIDLKALAEKIYELLKKEARIERERLGRRQIW